MPKKKSIKKAASRFIAERVSIDAFLARHAPTSDCAWTHEYAVLRLYRAFEQLMLEVLVGAVNNDTSTLSSRTGIQFPKHMTDEVCEYLLIGDGYFDFRGRAGLIKTVKSFVPDTHYLLTILKDQRYAAALERLGALRNYAAHSSARAKKAARVAVAQETIASAGKWLATQGRYAAIAAKCAELAQAIIDAAPY